MTLTQKVTRAAAAAAATVKDILQSDLEIVASVEEEREDDEYLERKERDKSIVEWIVRPLKPLSRNEDEEDEDKEEYAGAPLATTEDGSPSNEDNEGCEDDW